MYGSVGKELRYRYLCTIIMLRLENKTSPSSVIVCRLGSSNVDAHKSLILSYFTEDIVIHSSCLDLPHDLSASIFVLLCSLKPFQGNRRLNQGLL